MTVPDVMLRGAVRVLRLDGWIRNHAPAASGGGEKQEVGKMPGLVCSAQSCVYNNAMYCSRGDIQVGGENAKVCQDTCCESFVERKRESAKNSMGSPSIEIAIKCEAEHCRFNEGCSCHARHVDIAGAAACRCEETECVTFEDK